LVCESIRQFLLHKQRQQQQQQQQQGQSSAVPWRRPRDFLAQSSVDAAPQSAPATQRQRSSDLDPVQGSSGYASPFVDNRNMFQNYDFQFGSIGNFGRSYGSDVATPTGSRTDQARYSTGGCGPTAPIAVFRFQDFDDMVARMRDQNAPHTVG